MLRILSTEMPDFQVCTGIGQHFVVVVRQVKGGGGLHAEDAGTA